MHKIIIVGGGVAGLSAGIYAQRAGYDTVIYEKNNITGGSCSGWYRNGYAIDNCLHWLTGSKDGTEQNKLWKEVGVLNDTISIIKRNAFYSSEADGCCVTLWRDLEQTRSEMLELSPEDADEINAFMDSVIFVNDVLNSGMTPKDIIHAFSDGAFELSHFEFARFFMRYLSLNLEEWAAKFKHPALQGLILDFMAKEYESYWLIMAYSFFAFGNGDIIDGGSIGIAKNMTNSYLEAGGTLKRNCPVEKLLINKKKTAASYVEHTTHETKSIHKITTQHADGVLLVNGSKDYADYIICACDMNYTFNHLLKKKFTPKSLEAIYQNKKNCMIYSSFQVAFSVDGLFEEIDDTLGIECQPFEVAFESYHRMTIKNYRCYGDYIAPPEHTVIQCSLPQYEKDYHFWKKLYQNKALYNNTKRNIAEAIRIRIIERFPAYEGRIHLLDSWTPYSYALRNNDYKGAYMRFLTTPFNRNAFLPYEVKGLDNVYLAGHWLRYPGGLPTAVTTGKVVVQRIQDKEESTSS
jgi:phytoene dehydrogenase-like protein